MPQFTDKAGKVWRVEVDFGVVMDWKAECGLDLGDWDAVAAKMGEFLTLDPLPLAELLWVACRGAETAREPFVRGLPGDTDALREALAEAVVLFFLGRKRGPAALPNLRAILGPSTSNDSPTNSPESSESPTHGP